MVKGEHYIKDYEPFFELYKSIITSTVLY